MNERKQRIGDYVMYCKNCMIFKNGTQVFALMKKWQQSSMSLWSVIKWLCQEIL